jgi:hypothetical protein
MWATLCCHRDGTAPPESPCCSHPTTITGVNILIPLAFTHLYSPPGERIANPRRQAQDRPARWIAPTASGLVKFTAARPPFPWIPDPTPHHLGFLARLKNYSLTMYNVQPQNVTPRITRAGGDFSYTVPPLHPTTCHPPVRSQPATLSPRYRTTPCPPAMIPDQV